MTLYLSNRDGKGKTNEEGHYRLLARILAGNVLLDDDLKVVESSSPNMGIRVSAGDYRIPDPAGYAFMGWNSNYASATITTANPSNPRITTIVLYIDKVASTAASPPNNPGVPKIMAVNGTAASSPVAPNDTTIQSAVVSGNPFIRLANVLVEAGVTTITNSKITDLRQKIGIIEEVKEASNILSYVGEVIYPIGAIIENATNSANPSTYLGFGTWVKFAEGRVTVGKTDSAGVFNTAGSTGGTTSETITEAQMAAHTHQINAPNTGTSGVGNHAHTVDSGGNSIVTTSPGATNNRVAVGGAGQQLQWGGFATTGSGAHSHTVDIPEFTSGSKGNGAAHNNLQPYIVTYKWRRTA